MAKLDLDKLAAAGRGREQGASSAKTAAEAGELAAVHRKLLRKARLSCSPLYVLVKLAVFGAPLVACLGGIIVAEKDLLHTSTRAYVALAIAGSLLPPALLYLAAWVQGGPRLEREKAWLASLPFPLERHLETLGYFDGGGAISGLGAVTLEIQFAGPTPVEELAAACRGFDGRLKPETYEGRNDLYLRREDLVSDDSSNYRYYRWAHFIIDGLLLELAARYPIKNILVYSNHLGRTKDSFKGIYEKY